MWIKESQSWSKNLLLAKKERWILVTNNALLKCTSFLGVDKRKNSIKRIWTISIWQIHKDHYQKFLSGHRTDDRFSYARFEIYIQTVSLTEQFFIFFGFNIVCQLLARRLSKEIKTMKNYSDRLKPFFAQIRPSFTCTYLALVFSVNKWKSILIEKLAACKKKIGGCWLYTMHYSNIPLFFASTKEKNSIKRIWTISIWQIHKDHYQKFLSGHRIDERFSIARFEIYIQTVF